MCFFSACIIIVISGVLGQCSGIINKKTHRVGKNVIQPMGRARASWNGSSMRTQIFQPATIQYPASVVDEAVKWFNANYPGEKAQFTVFTFLRTAMDEEEAGDGMRGTVSMISGLDRLDEELKPAADIQIHMLPMIFPPFPDRREFDLYASMDPAKEVGGDFCDFFLVDPDHLALVIADVSGKGLACNAGHENPGFHQAGGRYDLIAYKHNIFLGVSRKARFADRPFVLRPATPVCLYGRRAGGPECRAGDVRK